jgi:hypothetical protein
LRMRKNCRGSEGDKCVKERKWSIMKSLNSDSESD